MPNWCANTVVVSGDSAEISAFNKFLDDGKGLLNKILPTPQELTDTVAGFHGDEEKQKALEEQQKANVEKYGYSNWYDWNVAKWGTKWDVDVSVDDSSTTDTEVIFSFDSAWAPPQKAISLLAEKFSKLNIRHSYFEEGMCFVGYDRYENGVVVDEVYSEDSDSDEWKELASEEFGWEPWPDEDTEEVEEAPKPAKKKVKKPAAKKKTTKKVAPKKKKKAKKK